MVYWPLLTVLGVIYFLAEVLVVCVLVWVELNVESATKHKSTGSID